MSLNIRYGVLLAATGLGALMSGCANEPMMSGDESFGASVRAARQAQTLNPAAPEKTSKTPGLDAQAAINAVGRYEDTFKTPPRSFEVLTIGTSPSGQ